MDQRAIQTSTSLIRHTTLSRQHSCYCDPMPGWWVEYLDGQPGPPIDKIVTANEIVWQIHLADLAMTLILHGAVTGDLTCSVCRSAPNHHMQTSGRS